jgi:hypothetical protein
MYKLKYNTCYPVEITLDHVVTVTDVCIQNPENINNCERVTEKIYLCVVLILQEYGLVQT